ncbi:hypothetical protein JCM17823_00240 [Halorubrum gandharaense]
MRLRTALTEHGRRREERFPAERPTTEGAFAGDDGRLVAVGRDGTLHDCSYPLSSIGGLDRVRIGVAGTGSVRWFDDLPTTRQHYAGDSPLVETEYDAGRYTVHQFDLTVGDTHLTHVELRGAPPTDATLVAACAFAPDMVEGRVGNLVHEGAGPDGGHVVEAFHRSEHDFLTASTGVAEARGRRQDSIQELLGQASDGFPRRGEIDEQEDSHLTADVVVRAPFERDGRAERVTLATRAVRDDSRTADGDGADRNRWIDQLVETATAHATADDLREAAAERAPDLPESAPRRKLLATDLRTLGLLTAESGGRIAAPEFDPFYATSGGYGYMWFRDDAEVSNALLAASDELGVDVDAELRATADFLCRTQDGDGGWPHRVWADSGKVAPGWANARIEGARTESGPDDQLDQPAAVVAFLARLRRTRDLPPSERRQIDATVADAVEFLVETTEDDGLPRRCQNCWENAIGRFTHTAATYLRAFAAVARGPFDAALRERAAEAAHAAAAGIDDRWLPDEERFPQRAGEDGMDARADASTFGIVDAVVEYVALVEAEGAAGAPPASQAAPATPPASNLDRLVDRVAAHVETSVEALLRESEEVTGLVRFTGDDWRTAEQSDAKVWSVATLWGAEAAAELGGLLESREEAGGPLFELSRDLYALCGPDGPLTNDAGLIAEQAFDDGTLDSATPIGWSHALRLSTTATLAQYGALPIPHDRPTGPEEAPQWTTGRKFGVGTPADHGTDDPVPLWYTLTEGAMTEVRFPRIDVMNLRTFDFLVADPETGYTIRTFDETSHETATETIVRTTEPADDHALAYRQTIAETGDEHGHEWTLTVEYAVDTDGDALLADVSFEGGREYDVYALVDTTLANKGTDDHGARVGDDEYHLLARNADAGREPGKLVDADGDPFDVALALVADGRFDWATAQTAGTEALAELFAHGEREPAREEATGNVVLAGRVGSGESVTDTLALGFAEHADTAAALGEAEGALSRGFDAVSEAYVETWHDWLEGWEYPDSVAEPDLETQYRFALMTLATVEDKRHPGAGIASPSVPWGETEHAAEERGYGYNFVWSRDLYQVFSVLVAVGEFERAADAVSYLYEVQQADDGFLPQNTYIDGRTRWGGEQMDNIAFPAVMAWTLAEHGHDLSDAEYGYENVRRSAAYVARNGPRTAQERWEEESGYSPSSIAAEVAGLVCAADLADEAGERADALAWLALADDWTDRVEEWCATDTGTERHTETPYYLRITADGNPNAGRARTIANDGPTYDEREIIDGGFLELVRLGIKPADDETIRNSVAAVDDAIRVDTPHGPAWYRYVGDAYGELGRGDPGGPWAGRGDGRGRLWPIFTGERGEYELRARADGPDAFGGTDESALEPDSLLRSMAGFANSGRMLPEQVWDREHPTAYGWEFGEGTGGATPLAWSMAGFIRLAHGIDAGEPVETPEVVRDRYVERDRPVGPDLRAGVDYAGEHLVVSGTTTGEVVAVHTDGEARLVEPTDGAYTVELDADTRTETVVVAAADTHDFDRAGTAVERLHV